MALIGAWSFDESGDTLIDLSGNENHFPITAGASRVVGHTGGGLQPSGATPVPLPDIGKTANRTVMMWLKGPMPDGWPIIWNVAALDSGAWGIFHNGTDIGVQARNSSGVVQAKVTWPDTTTWHHVAGTYAGNAVRLYLDGALAGSVSLVGPLSTDTDPPAMFGWSGSAVADDLRIYDSALEPAGILIAMNTPVASSDLSTAGALSVDTDFLARVTAAMQQYAVTIGNAILTATDPPQPIDKARLLLARAALANPTMYAAQFGWALGSDVAVDNTVDDATIRAKVAAVWNLIAGVPR